jgi:hypothetical protein
VGTFQPSPLHALLEGFRELKDTRHAADNIFYDL